MTNQAPVVTIRANFTIRSIPARRIALIIFQIKEDVMVEVTQAASQQISEYFKDRDVAPIRIFLNEGG